MKLLRKVESLRTNSSEDLFFRDHYEVGTKSGKYEIKNFFFREHQFLGILIRILPRAPNFEYPSLFIVPPTFLSQVEKLRAKFKLL